VTIQGSLPKGFAMTDSKPVVGTWVSCGILTGLLLVFMYLASLGPADWLHLHGPTAWQDPIELIYTPVILVLESERLPDWLTRPYIAWVQWWGSA
jgi:hypothetical protein